jgi:protein SCO1/2
MSMRRIVIGLAASLALVAATLLLGWWRVDGPGAERAAAPDDPRPSPLTEMAFALTDQDGRAVGPETLIGVPSMVFFGFTHCPEVCPTTLSDISVWLDDMGEEAQAITPVFITVDPERDTLEAMSQYVSFFHPSIQGWTGPPEQVRQAAEGFRVRYEKVDLGDGDYTMDHTASVFLFDEEGRFATAIDYHEPREFAVPKIRRAMGAGAEG